MSAPWLKRIANCANYRVFIYVCVLVVLLQFYFGHFLHKYSEHSNSATLNAPVPIEELNIKREEIYRNKYSIISAAGSKLSGDWAPDTIRKAVSIAQISHLY